MTLEFAGAARKLTDDDIAAEAAEVGLSPALIAAVADVESSGSGFMPDNRPRILFEAHVFGRLTDHRWDRAYPNISAAKWDRALYGAAGAHQYDRLSAAIALDRAAALQSASWGRFQVMGFNFKVCGWQDVESFVASMMESEVDHLEAFIGFCRSNNLLRHLQAQDWEAFAAGYNGSGQVEYYAGLLAAAYSRHATSAPVVIADAIIDDMKSVQQALRDEGFYHGIIDGDPGPETRAAMTAHRRRIKETIQ